MRGGIRPTEDKRPQKFIIDLEDESDGTMNMHRRDTARRTRDYENEDDDKDDGDGFSKDDESSNQGLSFVSYKTVPGKGKESSKVFDVLQLRWYTKYGCEGDAAKDPEDTTKGSHWGFFTWFIIMYDLPLILVEDGLH